MAKPRTARRTGAVKKNFKLTEREFLPEKLANEFVLQIRRENLWGKRLPSQREISRKLGVSLEAVNLAVGLLRKAGMVTSVPKQGVYVSVQKPTTPVVSSRRRMIFVCEGPTSDLRVSDYQRRVVAPLLELTAVNRMDVVVTQLDDNPLETSILSAWPPGPADFLVFVATSRKEELIRRIAERHPCRQVMVDHFFEGMGVTGVVDDGQGGMKALTEHLLEQGHERIAFFDLSRPEANPWKKAGHLAALEAAGLTPDPSLLINSYPIESIIGTAVEKLMRREKPPTALVAVDDGRALMILRALRGLGLEAGRDVAVAGYGDTAFAEGQHPALTSVRCDPARIGEAALDYLTGKLPGKDGEMIAVPAELVVRASTLGPRPGH